MIRGKKHTVKLAALGLALTMTFALTGCGAEEFENPYKDLNLAEYVTVGDYINLEATMDKVKVTDEEVQAEIASRLEAASTQVEVTEGTAASGDSVKIVYTGKIDGETFDGGSTGDEGTVITLGSSGYIAGFDDGVIGMKVGEKKDLNLTFPDDYWNSDLAGKPVVFSVELKAIMETKEAEYNLEFVKANSNAKSIEAYEESIRKELEEQKQAAAENSVKDQLWTAIMEGSKVEKYPEDMVEETKKINEEYYESYAEQYQMDLMEFIKMYTGMDEEAYNQYQQQYAEAIVAQEMVMYSIAEKEGITLSKSEYKAALKELMESQGITDEEEFKSMYGMSFEEYAGKDNLAKSFLLEKILDFAVENAKIKVQ